MNKRNLNIHTDKKILYLLPAPSMEGGMTATTQMFYDAGVFNNKNIYHFDTKFKWHTHTFIRFFESPVLKFRFILALIKYKPDIIFVIMSPYWGFYDKIMYCLIAKLFGVKSIFNSVSGRFTKFYESNFINRFWVNQLIKIPDYVVLGTPYWSRYFKAHFPIIKIAEIPNPVITDEFSHFNKEPNKQITIVSAFRITKEKGIVELCRVIQKVTACSNQFKFIILGDGPELAWLRNELSIQLKNGMVELKGFVTGKEKIKSIINADAYIMLSHFDMMPIALLEAMSASLPIFSTRTGGIPDMIEEGTNGHLFEVGEVDQVVSKLLHYEHKKENLAEMGKRNYDLVKNKYDIEVIIKKQINLAQNLTASKKLNIKNKIYEKMPPFIQNLGISYYGYLWNKRRFGGIYQNEYKKFVAREKYDSNEWNKYQEEQLQIILQHAYQNVPYYKDVLSPFKDKLSSFKLNELKNIPILEKSTVRAFGTSQLLSKHLEKGGAYFASSGSTGTPTNILISPRMHQVWTAGFEARIRNWAGVTKDTPRGTIGGRRIIAEGINKGPYYRYNQVERQVYFSAYHISASTVHNYLEGMYKHGIEYMTGYAMSNYFLARFIEENGLQAPKLKAVITSSEKLTPEMRDTFKRVYGCKSYDSYSGVEDCGMISECEHGKLHISPDLGIIEIIKSDGEYALPGEIGEAICTGILNFDQPLIRYRIGDLLKLASNQICECGRNMPIVDEIVGRLEDTVIGADGREMVRFHGIFINIPEIIEGQIIQNALKDFEIKVVTSQPLDASHRELMLKRMQSQLGEISLSINEVESIPRNQNGKFKAVISNLKR